MKMKCSYCRKEINPKKQSYGVLISGLLICHSDNSDDDCYTKAFRDEKNTLRGILFNINNSVRYKIFKISFFVQYVWYMTFKRDEQVNENEKSNCN